MRCKVDLTQVDTYHNGVIPDKDVEICLKVLRTIRNTCLGAHYFDAESGVTVSKTLQIIYDITANIKRAEIKDRGEL